MEKTYDPRQWEGEIYQKWLEKKLFESYPNKDKKNFSIVMPPPNVTGQLHMGHALDNTVQDVLIRRKRMQGYEAMWLPGTDHAAIATEAKIVEALAKEGLTKEGIGREAFLKRTEEWYKLYGNKIIEQLHCLGVSCDWNRLSFTLDERLCKAVKHVFVQYYNRGYIYRGKRVVNWCPHCKTSISDTENVYKEQTTSLWYIKYPYQDGTGYLTVATTRPETIFGDTAVAVNPDDKKYKDIVGKNVILPLVGKPIKVVADSYCEIGFGTGAVKITPAHDPNDYELGLRHGLEVVTCIEDDGKLNSNAGKFSGRDRIEARADIVKELEKEGFLLKTETYKNKVGCCDRCKEPTEPKISTQWFVKMEELAKPAIECVKDGRLKYFPKMYEKQHLNWLESIKDWCVSRQLWLGHRLPVYYCDACGEIIVAEEEPKKCPKCGCTHFTQDSDVLDTWFSSALWPFSTLGYPEITEDLKYYYPTSVLVTAYDIIPFWVTKMVFSGLEFMGDVPFKDVCIHGIVRDGQGRKMSKSLNNGIDPIEIVEKYGADSTRLSLVIGTSMGYDMNYGMERPENCKIFINKLWNASKFVLTFCDGIKNVNLNGIKLNSCDKWILSQFNELVKFVNKKLDKYELGVASSAIYDFVWNKFCDWEIEVSKLALHGQGEEEKLKTQKVLVYLLENVLKLLHPFTPFVTEKIYQEIYDASSSIMRQSYPKYSTKLDFDGANDFEKIIDLIKNVRNTRTEMGVKDNVKTSLYLIPAKEESLIKENLQVIEKLAGGKDIKIISEQPKDEKCVKIISEICLVLIPSSELFDSEKERERLTAELDTLKFEIARSEKMLSNERFIEKAPKSLIDAEKEKLKNNNEKLTEVQKSLSEL